MMHINADGKSLGLVVNPGDRDVSMDQALHQKPLDIFESESLGFSDYAYATNSLRFVDLSEARVLVTPAENLNAAWWDDLKHLVEALPVVVGQRYGENHGIDEATKQSLRELASAAPHRMITF